MSHFQELYLEIPFEGSLLSATFTLPNPSLRNRGSMGALLMTGLRGNRNGHHSILAQMSRRLAEKGVFSIRFDYSGCCESAGKEVDGSMVQRRAREAVALVDFAEAQGWCTSMGVLGMSSGGWFAVRAARLLGKRCPRVVLMGVRPHPDSHSKKWKQGNKLFNFKQVGEGFDVSGVYFSDDSMNETLDFDTIGELKAADATRLLIIHGEKDELYDVKLAQEYQVCKQQTQIEIIPDIDHVFRSREATNSVNDLVVQFFSESLPVGQDYEARFDHDGLSFKAYRSHSNRWLIAIPQTRGDRISFFGTESRVARELAKHGINTLSFDHRGCGESEPLEGEVFASRVEDVRRSCELIRRDFPDSRIALMGTGLGALLANHVAASGLEVDFVVGINLPVEPVMIFHKYPRIADGIDARGIVFDTASVQKIRDMAPTQDRVPMFTIAASETPFACVMGQKHHSIEGDEHFRAFDLAKDMIDTVIQYALEGWSIAAKDS